MSVSYYRIGRNIAAERNRAGLTQEEMAERMGISVSHYSNIERANRHATIDFLVCMCETLGIPLARLVHGYCQELCANTTASLMKLVRRRPNRPQACSA